MALALAVLLFGVGAARAVSAGSIGTMEVLLLNGPTPSGDRMFHARSPALNDAGQVAFEALLLDAAGNRDGGALFRWSGGVLEELARTGDLTPPGDNTYLSFDAVALNDAGYVLAFQRSGSALFLHDGNQMTEVSRAGRPAPDGEGTCCSNVDIAALNDAGHVAFAASAQGGAQPGHRILRWDGQTLSSVVRRGEQGPEGDGSYVRFRDPFLNEAGQIGFEASIETPGAPSPLFRVDPAGVRELFREGDPGPGGEGSIDPAGLYAMNGRGDLGLSGFFHDPSTGADRPSLYVIHGSEIVEVVSSGRPAPDGNGRLSSFFDGSSMNDAGHVVFDARLVGTAGERPPTPEAPDDNGLFLFDGATILQLAREGSPVPGGDGVFDDQLMEPGPRVYFAINNAGQVAFNASLRDSSRGGGLFFFDPVEGLIWVGGPGSTLLGSPITEVGFAAGSTATLLLSGLSPGEEYTGLNDAGQVAFSFSLEDGRSGIALWSLPEPAPSLLLVLALAPLARSRSRTHTFRPTILRIRWIPSQPLMLVSPVTPLPKKLKKRTWSSVCAMRRSLWLVAVLGSGLLPPSPSEAIPLEDASLVAMADDPAPRGDGVLSFPESRFVLNEGGQGIRPESRGKALRRRNLPS